jgi:D-methionine transport system ATP-binding protein
MAMIELKDIRKTYTLPDGAKVQAVNGVTLEIEQGDIFGIIGFSGAGKSTLVRCINLLERPDEGSVHVAGVDLLALSPAELRAARRKIGMIFQGFSLMPSRTVEDNIELALRHSTLTKDEKKAKIASLLELVGLGDRAQSYPSQLSGGQKQRVAIARALANDPKVLLCDEATSALDPQTTRSILKLLKSVNEKLGITMVVITHQMEVVKHICRRAAVMEHGRIVEEGPAAEIFSHPKAPITKSFIDTASNVDSLRDYLEDLRSSGKANGPVYLLTYVGNEMSQPLMVEIYKRFGVTASILFGSADFVAGTPIGRLGVTLAGPEENVSRALEYIRSLDVTTEAL